MTRNRCTRRNRILWIYPIAGRERSVAGEWSTSENNDVQCTRHDAHERYGARNMTELTLAVVAITPNALKVSYSNRSSTLSSKFPMNRLAPTSSCFLSEEAWIVRINISNCRLSADERVQDKNARVIERRDDTREEILDEPC